MYTHVYERYDRSSASQPVSQSVGRPVGQSVIYLLIKVQSPDQHFLQRSQNFDTQLLLWRHQRLGVLDQSTHTHTHTSDLCVAVYQCSRRFCCQGTWTYLEMNPPDSQRCRASVPSRNSSSGWWRTSTNTDSSAFTKGFKRSSRVLMMSWMHTHKHIHTQLLKVMVYCMSRRTLVFIHVKVKPEVSLLCSCSPRGCWRQWVWRTWRMTCSLD